MCEEIAKIAGIAKKSKFEALITAKQLADSNWQFSEKAVSCCATPALVVPIEPIPPAKVPVPQKAKTICHLDGGFFVGSSL